MLVLGPRAWPQRPSFRRVCLVRRQPHQKSDTSEWRRSPSDTGCRSIGLHEAWNPQRFALVLDSSPSSAGKAAYCKVSRIAEGATDDDSAETTGRLVRCRTEGSSYYYLSRRLTIGSASGAQLRTTRMRGRDTARLTAMPSTKTGGWRSGPRRSMVPSTRSVYSRRSIRATRAETASVSLSTASAFARCRTYGSTARLSTPRPAFSP